MGANKRQRVLFHFCLLLLISTTRGRSALKDGGRERAANGVITPAANTSQSPAKRDQQSVGNTTVHHGDAAAHGAVQGGHGIGDEGISVAGFYWDHVKQPFIITLVLMSTGLLKIGFHYAWRLPQILPESCLLIILGTIVGGILHFFQIDRSSFPSFTSSLFFLVLLPPIILESSYSLYDRVFFDNLGTILLYAVVGTIMNCFLIGPTLYGLAVAGFMGQISINFVQCLVFASLIIAVDPVAVLAIFQETGVNNVLYFLVFGESLLNDAVTVVLYNMMKAFNRMETVPVSEIFLAIASFFTISLLGMTIGIIFGILTALVTKCTDRVRVVEPLAVFTLAYSSYLTADMFGFSGIISIFACGLVQAHFSFHNVSHKSSTTVLYFSKVMSTTCDCIIFMFLGLALWKKQHVWHTGFVLWTIGLCLVVRFMVVYFLTFLANKMKRIRKIDFEEQFIMAYGGLRGAVAFSLVAMLDSRELPMNLMFETTTLVVVIFTVFVQGISIKPLVKLLRIRKQGEKVVSLFDEINNHVTDHVLAGIEEIVGYSGRNTFRRILDYYDDRYLKRILQRSPLTKDEHIMELYKEIAIQDHYDNLACSINMDRYSSQMMLYHPCLEKDDTPFVTMAKTHPELADIALDTHLRRRSTRVRGYEPRRFRTITGPSRMISDPGPDSSSGVAMDPDSVGFTRKTTSVTSDPRQLSDVTVGELRRWLVKPHEALHQKHDRNLLENGSRDLVHLLQEKQRRTSRYLQALSVSVTPDTGSPLSGSPTAQRRPFAFPRPRPPSYPSCRRSFPQARIRYHSDGPASMQSHGSEVGSPPGARVKFRSASARSAPGSGTSTSGVAGVTRMCRRWHPIRENLKDKANNNTGKEEASPSPRQRVAASTQAAATVAPPTELQNSTTQIGNQPDNMDDVPMDEVALLMEPSEGSDWTGHEVMMIELHNGVLKWWHIILYFCS